MKTLLRAFLISSTVFFVPSLAWADQATRTLDVYWVDSEGGGSTLIVTPAGESILIDSGYPANADRVVKAAKETAGLKKLDYAIVTHFHADHFGGMATIASQIPVAQLWDNGIPDLDPDHKPDSSIWLRTSKPYREIKADKHVVNAGDAIPIKQTAGGAKLSFRCVAAKQTFVDAPSGVTKNPLTAELVKHDVDTTDNANSSVWVLDFGPFRFFDGGDLTWNREGELVTPLNRVGQVDVYQVDHHGLALSNNPVLIHSLAPTIAVMNNGPKKGTAKSTIEGLKSSPGLQAIYQNHKNVRPGEAEVNTTDEYIANMSEDSNACTGNYIKMTVAADGKSYTIEIPATGLKKTYQTRLKEKESGVRS